MLEKFWHVQSVVNDAGRHADLKLTCTVVGKSDLEACSSKSGMERRTELVLKCMQNATWGCVKTWSISLLRAGPHGRICEHVRGGEIEKFLHAWKAK